MTEIYYKLLPQLESQPHQEWLMSAHSTLLAFKLRDATQLQELMSNYCRLSGDSYRAWHDYLEKMKAVDLTRTGRLYIKAFKSVKDKQQLIGKEWLDFEKLFGTSESLSRCEQELVKQAPAIKEEP